MGSPGPPVLPPELSPVVGQVSVGTQANFTWYESPGLRTREGSSWAGSGRLTAGSPATCLTGLPIFAASAAPAVA